MTKILFGDNLFSLSSDEMIKDMDGDPRLQTCEADVMRSSTMLELAVVAGLTPSKGRKICVLKVYGFKLSTGAARTLISQGGLYLNNKAVVDPKATLEPSDFIDQRVVVLRGGKNKYKILLSR